MATRYLTVAASAAARNNQLPTVPNAAGVVFRTDSNTLEIKDPDGNVHEIPVESVLGQTFVQTAVVELTTAQANAGATLLPAVDGYKYRLIDFTVIAQGGNAATATSVRINGTQAASGVNLATIAIAALTRSVAVKPNSANVTLLADGAAFDANDENTAITLDVNNDNLATATGLLVVLQYVLEAA